MKKTPPRRSWIKPALIAVASAPWTLMAGGTVMAFSHCEGESTEEISEPELVEIGLPHQEFLGQIGDPKEEYQCRE